MTRALDRAAAPVFKKTGALGGSYVRRSFLSCCCAVCTKASALARAARLSWPSRGAPGYPAPLQDVSGLWVYLVVLLHALHARQPLPWAASTALVSSWRSQLFFPLPPQASPSCSAPHRLSARR
jgi:hypothetical protein